ncbi:MAG: AbrB/MazE/SpoVT family DNA-binding domain-containing protein [Burkholderiaceae bacterium]|jgi:Growth regulator
MGANDLPTGGLDLTVSRWGNSLAVRLPAALARELGVREGDTLHLQPPEATPGGAWQLSARRQRPKLSKEELIARIREHLASMPLTESVIEEVRANERY